MKINTTITISTLKESEAVLTAISVIQTLEHLFDGVDQHKMDIMSQAYDILESIEFEEGLK